MLDFPVVTRRLPLLEVSGVLARQSIPIFRQRYLPTNRFRTNRKLGQVHYARRQHQNPNQR